MNEEELKDLLNTIEDNIPVEECRSEGSSDGLCHYELDTDSWQYKTLEYIKNLQQEKQQLKEDYIAMKKERKILLEHLNSVENKRDLYKSVIDEIRNKIEDLRMEKWSIQGTDIMVLLEILDKANIKEGNENE